MLMSIVRSIVVRCWQRTIDVTMLLEHELTIVDEKSLLIVVNNDWTMVVEGEQLWTMLVDNSCWQGAAHCWQCAAQHCSKLLTTLIKLFIFARVPETMKQNSTVQREIWLKIGWYVNNVMSTLFEGFTWRHKFQTERGTNSKWNVHGMCWPCVW